MAATFTTELYLSHSGSRPASTTLGLYFHTVHTVTFRIQYKSIFLVFVSIDFLVNSGFA